MARPVDFTPAASQPTAVAIPQGQDSFAGAGTDALTKDTGRFELAGDTVAPGTRTPFGEGTGPGSRSVAEVVTGFDPDWGEPPETVQGGLLKWNPTRLIYELRPGAAPPYGSKQRYLHDELARLEAQGIFIQPYVNELVPETWRFRWVRVPTDSPEVGKAYKVIGPLKEHYVGAAIELARHPREVPETPEVPEIAGPALPTALDDDQDAGIEIAGETPPTVLHGDEPEGPEISGDAVTTILQDAGDPLFGYQDDDKYKPGPKQFQMSDYAWLTQEDLPSGCTYPYALMPVPIPDYESGAWLEPDYEPSIPLPEPYPVWQCGRIGPELVPHKTVGEGSIGKLLGLGPKFGLTPPPPPTPEPPPPPAQVEIDIPMHSITRELFPKTEVEISLPADVKTPDLALSELNVPPFGWPPDEQYTPGPKPIDPKKFAWIPQHELPVGCPYPYLFMPVPLADFYSGEWLQPGYVPSIELPKPHDEVKWQCGTLPGETSRRTKGKRRPDEPYYGVIQAVEVEPPKPPVDDWSDEETEEEVSKDADVQRLRKKRAERKEQLDALLADRKALDKSDPGYQKKLASLTQKINDATTRLGRTTASLSRRELKVANRVTSRRLRALKRDLHDLEHGNTGLQKSHDERSRLIAELNDKIAGREELLGKLRGLQADTPMRESIRQRDLNRTVALELVIQDVGSKAGVEPSTDGATSVAELGDDDLERLKRVVLSELDDPSNTPDEADRLKIALDEVENESRGRKDMNRYHLGTAQPDEARDRGVEPSEQELEFVPDPRGGPVKPADVLTAAERKRLLAEVAAYMRARQRLAVAKEQLVIAIQNNDAAKIAIWRREVITRLKEFEDIYRRTRKAWRGDKERPRYAEFGTEYIRLGSAKHRVRLLLQENGMFARGYKGWKGTVGSRPKKIADYPDGTRPLGVLVAWGPDRHRETILEFIRTEGEAGRDTTDLRRALRHYPNFMAPLEGVNVMDGAPERKEVRLQVIKQHRAGGDMGLMKAGNVLEVGSGDAMLNRQLIVAIAHDAGRKASNVHRDATRWWLFKGTGNVMTARWGANWDGIRRVADEGTGQLFDSEQGQTFPSERNRRKGATMPSVPNAGLD